MDSDGGQLIGASSLFWKNQNTLNLATYFVKGLREQKERLTEAG